MAKVEQHNDAEMEKRIKSEQTMHRITNDDLLCKNCLLRMDDTVIFGNTSRCEQYPAKPVEVLIGGGCPYFIKE